MGFASTGQDTPATERKAETLEIIDKGSFVIKREKVYYGDPDGTVIDRAYTQSGDYIDDIKTAEYLCNEKGIQPKLSNPTHNVCSIGFSGKEQKWYGWSHRAICGFGVGDTVNNGDCTASSGYTEEYLKDHPEDDLSLPVGFVAKNLDDAKLMAIAFADSVS